MRLGHAYLVMFLARGKYYAAWNIAELSCILAGLSPNGEAQNANMFAVETSGSIAETAGRWNKTVAHWLKHYIYKRSGLKSKTASMVLTRSVSAFWHGFYPGYFMTFLFLVLGDKAEQVCRKNLKTFAQSRIYHMLGWMFTFFSFSYYGAPFFLFNFNATLKFWTGLFWVGHAAHLIVILAGKLGARGKKPATE